VQRKASQPNTVDPVIARAIKALREKFEDALIVEWDIRRDGAKIRNAMRTLPNRCRKCKKPWAGIAGGICACKTKIELECYFSNPRDALCELIQQRFLGIQTSRSLTTFVEQITSVGIAHDRDLAWIGRQIQGLWPSLSRVFRRWTIGICWFGFAHNDNLPLWWKDHGEISETDLNRTLSNDDSEAELVRLDAEIAQHFEEARKAALDQASIQLAQHVRPNSERPPRGRARQDIAAAMIARIKRDNPDWSIERICQDLDAKDFPPRESDRRAGFSKWHPMWKDPKFRNRIKRFISAIEPAAAEKRV
jgi:hypothetical protein